MKYALSIAALSALLAGSRHSAEAVSVGASTDLGTPTLEITVNGAAENVPNNQYAYFSRGAKDQDRLQWTMTLDGSGRAELVGNMWKALKIAPHDVVYNTVLEFDVRVEDPAEVSFRKRFRASLAFREPVSRYPSTVPSDLSRRRPDFAGSGLRLPDVRRVRAGPAKGDGRASRRDEK